jgi:hypothetical protein
MPSGVIVDLWSAAARRRFGFFGCRTDAAPKRRHVGSLECGGSTRLWIFWIGRREVANANSKTKSCAILGWKYATAA